MDHTYCTSHHQAISPTYGVLLTNFLSLEVLHFQEIACEPTPFYDDPVLLRTPLTGPSNVDYLTVVAPKKAKTEVCFFSPATNSSQLVRAEGS